VGAVQKLATVVIIGLVALATVLTVYIADEPNRRDSESTEQDVLAIERGTDLYIQYCLQCHGATGLGAAEGTGRVGGVLNQPAYQSDDPATISQQETWAHYRITYGIPADPIVAEKRMPAFGTELNVEEINDLVYMIMNVDWNYVYNESVLHTGETLHEACEATPDLEECGQLAEVDGHPVAYPTVPPTPAPTADPDEPSTGDPETDDPSGGTAEPVAVVEASDTNAWSVTELTVKPGDTIAVNNPGVLAHDFVVDDWSVKEDLPGGAQTTVTIPADAEPGTYTFYCSVPGHREQGMEGTITVEAP
jgi:plastocyanin/mono/diheme cytochrome c family protein